MQPFSVISAICLADFLALRLFPISFPWWDFILESWARSILSLAFMINTNWLRALLVEFGNVASPALRFQSDGSATGIFLYQYSFV